jgi:cytosine/adenosine deaminase-related metal-dependent hydrolase
MTEKIVRGGSVICDARRPGGGAIEGGAVAIRGSTIAAVGTFAELQGRFSQAEVIGSERHVVIPGLVNTHHHGWGLTPFQLGAKDDLLEPWIVDLFQALRSLDPYLDTLWADLQNIRSGVTTLLHASLGRDWGAYEHEVRAKLRAHADSGIRAAFALHISDQNTFVYQDDEEFLGSLPASVAEGVRDVLNDLNPLSADRVLVLLRRLVEEYGSHPRVSIMICPVAPQWCSDDLLRRVRGEADDLDVLIHLHCLESPYQREYGHRVYGTGMLRHLHDLGFLDSRVSLAHAVWLSDEEMDICGATGTSVCHNPSSNLRLRVGILPLARLLEKGVNVSIGMDGTGINDNEDMLQELRLVAKLHRFTSELPPDPPPSSHDVLRMATANGARTLGADADIGVLEPGRKADVVLIDADRLRFPYLDPATDPVDAILYRALGVDVDTVLIDGEVVLRDGKFERWDADEIGERLAEAAATGPSDFHKRWSAALEELRPFIASFWEGWTGTPVRPYYRVNSSI